MQMGRLTPRMIEAARFMLDEMHQFKLTVCKVPGYDGGRDIRAAIVSNPDWYSRFCNKYLVRRRNSKWKRSRTNVKRCHTILVLTRIVEGKPSSGKYFEELIDAIEWNMPRIFDDDGAS